MTDTIAYENENITDACDGNAENRTAAEDTRETIPEKTFTQSQLEALIAERLKRERKNAEDLRSVKDLLTKLGESGTLKSSSYSKMADELRSLLSDKNYVENGKQETVGDCTVTTDENAETPSEQKNAKQESVTAENVNSQTIGAAESEEKIKGTAFSLTADEARAIKKAHPMCDIGELLCDRSFEAFSRGRSGRVQDVYGDYLTFLAEYENRNENLERRMFADTAATSFSASDKAYFSDGSEGLTRRQMEIARQNGMSYREYSSLLENIPRSPKF